MRAASKTAPVTSPPDRPVAVGSDRGAGWTRSGLALAAVAVVVLGFFLSIYIRRHIPVPLGWDTSRYLWQTSFVQAEGLDALQEPLPPPYKSSLSRPAFPVIAATVSSVTGVSTFRVAAVLPAALAVVIGVTAGAFVSTTLRRSIWELVGVALALATCAYVVRLAAPEAYQDNLFAAAILVAAAIPIVFSVTGIPGMVLPAVALLTAGAVTHWVFFAFFAGVLAVSGLGLIPRSWQEWRSGTPLWRTPGARLGVIVGSAAALGAGIIFGLLGASPEQPKFSRPEFRKKLRQDLPRYRLSVALPLAALGAGSLLLGDLRSRPGDPVVGGDAERRGVEANHRAMRRYVAVLLVAWVLVALAGVIAFREFGRLLPAHRFLAFALAVPILGIVGVLAVGRWVAGRLSGPWRVARATAGAGVVAAIILVSGITSYESWDSQQVWARMDRDKVSQAATAGAYLDRLGVPDDEPFVFIVDDRGVNPDAYVGLMTHMIRAALPAERLRSLHIFVGDPEDFLRGRPTLDGRDTHDNVSRRFLDSLRPILDDRPIAFVAAAVNDHAWARWIQTHPDSRIGADVAIVQGPRTETPVAAPPLAIGPLRAYQWLLFGGGLVALLGVIGLGWTGALFGPRLRRFESLALAPAIGLAAIVIGGILADRAGLLLVGFSGGAVAVVTAAGGYAAWLVMHRRRDAAPVTPAAAG